MSNFPKLAHASDFLPNHIYFLFDDTSNDC